MEFDKLATKFMVEPVNAIIINAIGKMTTRTRKTRRNAAIVDRERFS